MKFLTLDELDELSAEERDTYKKEVIYSFKISDKDLITRSMREIQSELEYYWSDAHEGMLEYRDFNKYFEPRKKELERRQIILKEQQAILKEQDDTYVKGGVWYKYKKNSKAKSMAKSRAKRARPKNISPDYTEEIYDLIKELDSNGKKVRNGKVTKVLNKDKCEELIKKLAYQFKIKKTTLIYNLIDGSKKIASNIDAIVQDIFSGQIDISQGIYANQFYHLDISRNNIKFMTFSDFGCYTNARKYLMKYKNSIIHAELKNKQNIVIKNLHELKEAKDLINWNGNVRWYTTTPKNKDTDKWNNEMNGYWLPLGRLSTEEDIKKYETDICISAPFKNILNIKYIVDKYSLRKNESSLKKYLTSMKVFSYDLCNEVLRTGTFFKKIKKYYSKYFNIDDFINSSNNITNLFSESIMCEAGGLFKNCIILKLAKAFRIDMSTSKANSELDEYFNRKKNSGKLNKQMIGKNNREVENLDMTFYNIDEVKSRAEHLYDKRLSIYESWICDGGAY